MDGFNRHPKSKFFCDLDRTLIYSHRVPIEGKKLIVEFLNGEEQSYMTQYTYDFFRAQDSVQLIPVTTRSKEQYERIFVFKTDIPCKYALLCNGGVLLIDGREDESWYYETMRLIDCELESLQEMKTAVARLSPSSQIHDVRGLFFYIKHEHPARFAEQLTEIASTNPICVLHDQHKVYCLPKRLNKGTAVERFKARFGSNTTIAAGDSAFDIPMLVNADIALVPSLIEKQILSTNKIHISNLIFSEGICDYLKTLQK